MKISKVNHIKTAITVEDNKQKGILYKNPTDGNESTDLEQHITKLVDKAEKNFGSGFKYSVSDTLSKEEKEKAIQKKNKFKNNIKKSIENQNMIIQPVEIDDDMVIALSMVKGEQDSGSNVLSRKAREKSAFRRFLSDYANLDIDYRMESLRKIRRIVLIYFYGEDAIGEDIKADFDVWDNHKEKQSDLSKYVDYSFPKIAANDNYDKKTEEEIYKALADSIRKSNIASYRTAENIIKSSAGDSNNQFFDDEDLNYFWIHHIENEVERIYKKTNRIKRSETYKLCKGYISEKVWKGIINYICIKYIAIGKVVFNMAMEDVTSDGDENLGIIAESYRNGISSFDYEMIKAEERLQRETAVYTTFAINNFLAETVEKDEKKYDLNDDLNTKSGLKRRVLQFYGGESRWKDFDFDSYSEEDSEKYLWNQIRSILNAMRNESFHFKTENYRDNWDKKLILNLFKADSKECSKSEINKFYSNNIPMFYGIRDIEKLLYRLYDEYTIRASQVPSFNTVFVRKNFPEIIKGELHINISLSAEDLDKFQSSLYYMMKEIYYNAFLCDDASKGLFIDAVKNMRGADDNQIRATKDFQSRIKEIISYRDYSLSEICQIIMTEYNQQNDKWMKKRTNKGKKNRPDGYQHYKVLLFEGLRRAFLNYLKNNKDYYGFINNPSLRDMPAKEAFLPEFITNRYNHIIEEFEKDTEIQKWYVTGRFLNPKQVNYLAGCFRNYIQYKWDIKRRAEDTGNNVNVSEDALERYEKILQVLEICIKLNGNTTNLITDYFVDEDDYADYVAGFLDYGTALDSYDISPSGKLKEFCNSYSKELDDSTINIYYDGEHPILNRNIVLSKLYGNGKIISEVLKDNKVNLDDVREYYRSRNALSQYRIEGTFKNEEDLKNIKKYQEIKNRVEFRDVVEYSELLNELQGQLINYCFLRERDLLYFQLGFHFSCLKNDSYKPGDYMKIETDSKVISNAILHQLVSLYVNGIHLYVKNDDGVYVEEKDSSAGGNISTFLNFCKKAFNEFSNNDTVYVAGLELFENINEHGEIIDLRNYIDHFHFYHMKEKVNEGRSMIDIYSEIFDRFFTYDIKYHKNVPNVLYNILMRHFVSANFEFSTGMKIVGEKKNKTQKERASLQITKVSAEPFTYKLGNKKVECPAKSEIFLQNVVRLLYYRQEIDPGIKYFSGKIQYVKSDNNTKSGKNNTKNSNSKNRGKNNSQKRDGGRLSSNPFDDLLNGLKF